jgi:hypothetical protein
VPPLGFVHVKPCASSAWRSRSRCQRWSDVPPG